MVFGNTPIAEYSAYSIYTYDAQPIGSPRWGYGYRNRWMVQTGISLTPQ
jgi:hypothetical protein